VEARVDEEVVEFLNDKKRVEALLQQHGLSGLELDAVDARYAELEDNKMALRKPPSIHQRASRGCLGTGIGTCGRRLNRSRSGFSVDAP